MSYLNFNAKNKGLDVSNSKFVKVSTLCLHF